MNMQKEIYPLSESVVIVIFIVVALIAILEDMVCVKMDSSTLLINKGDYMRIILYNLELDKARHGVLVEEKLYEYAGTSLSNPQSVVTMLNTIFHLNRRAEECVFMVSLNSKFRPLGLFEISHGSVNLSICNPREIFIRALLCGATNIIIAHNHPSGDTAPSDDDVNTYCRVKEAGELIGVNLLDSLIIGDDYFSFKESSQGSGEIISID